MGDTFRGAAISPTDERTNYMIMALSIGIVLALAVGGFVMAANSLGDQDHSPLDDPQKIVLDTVDFDLAEIVHTREPDFVMESESSCWGPFNTERGWIYWDGYYIPEELPLCINNDTLADWYVYALSYGGYEPYGGFIDVCQKFDYKGRIFIEWTDMGKGDYDCCTYNWWMATFYVQEEFCLDSNQYPEGSYDGEFIPDKEVYFYPETWWTGCGHESQHFTIIHSHSYQAFSKSLILTLETKTTHNPQQSTRSVPQTVP